MLAWVYLAGLLWTLIVMARTRGTGDWETAMAALAWPLLLAMVLLLALAAAARRVTAVCTCAADFDTCQRHRS